MKRTRLTVLAIAAALVAAPILGGTAEALFITGGLTVNYGNTYTISCKATETKCIEMQTCDEQPSSDIFQQVLAVTSPATLVGKTEDDTAINGYCTGVQTICRAGTTVGVMKGLAMITHPGGTDGNLYTLEIHCLDKNSDILPENTLKVIQTEFNN